MGLLNTGPWSCNGPQAKLNSSGAPAAPTRLVCIRNAAQFSTINKGDNFPIRTRLAMATSQQGAIQLPEFSGNVAEYRDWKRAIKIRHAGATDEHRKLTATRVLTVL